MKKIVLSILLGIGVIYFLKITHLHNFLKGKNELKELYRYEITTEENPNRLPKFIYVAHAGGGYQGKTYLNSIEAINNSYNLGVDFIEVDINYTKDSVAALAHDFINKSANDFLKDKGLGTHLLLEDLFLWLNDKKVFIITDIKVDNLKILHRIKKHSPSQSAKIIPQVYTISEIIQVKKMGYKNVIFTNYVSLYPNSIIQDLASSKSLFGITLPYDYNFKALIYFGSLRKMEVPVFTHTVNDLKISSELLQEGCSGIYTDFLLASSD